MSANSQSPFVFSGPVPRDKFIGRQSCIDEIYQLISIEHEHSILIVGRPKIGKSSLLNYINTPELKTRKLGRNHKKYLFCEVDCHVLTSNFGPTHFWAIVLRAIANAIPQSAEYATAVKSQIDKYIRKQIYDSLWLVDFFNDLKSFDLRTVILIDEFDSLLMNANMNSYDFWAPLRSLCTRHGLRIIATASRRTAVISERIRPASYLGSPLLNHFSELFLGPFSENETNVFINAYLTHSQIASSPTQISFIKTQAGRLPFLLQKTAAEVFRSPTRGLDFQPDEVRRALWPACEWYCSNAWSGLDDVSRTVASFLVGRRSSKPSASWPIDAPELSIYAPPGLLSDSLSALSKAGILQLCAAADADRPAVHHQGRTYHFASELLLAWISREKLASTELRTPRCARQRLPELPILAQICEGEPAAQQAGPHVCKIHNANVRELLNAVLNTESAFEAFCIDYFSSIHRMFSANMDRVTRLNLLLQQSDPDEILVALWSYGKERVTQHAKLLIKRPR